MGKKCFFLARRKYTLSFFYKENNILFSLFEFDSFHSPNGFLKLFFLVKFETYSESRFPGWTYDRFYHINYHQPIVNNRGHAFVLGGFWLRYDISLSGFADEAVAQPAAQNEEARRRRLSATLFGERLAAGRTSTRRVQYQHTNTKIHDFVHRSSPRAWWTLFSALWDRNNVKTTLNPKSLTHWSHVITIAVWWLYRPYTTITNCVLSTYMYPPPPPAPPPL